MTPRAAQLTARLRIARKVGRRMLCRLGLCSHADPKEVFSRPAPLARTSAAANPTAEPFRGIAPMDRLTLPAEAASGRPGTAGTQE